MFMISFRHNKGCSMASTMILGFLVLIWICSPSCRRRWYAFLCGCSYDNKVSCELGSKIKKWVKGDVSDNINLCSTIPLAQSPSAHMGNNGNDKNNVDNNNGNGKHNKK